MWKPLEGKIMKYGKIGMVVLLSTLYLVGAATQPQGLEKEDASLKEIVQQRINSEPGSTMTTYERMDWQKASIDQLRKRMELYLDKARERFAKDKKLLQLIDESQKRWEAYTDAEYAAVYQYWGDGSMAGVAAQDSLKQLIRFRTYVIWENYLTFMDSTPPLLPEPKLH